MNAFRRRLAIASLVMLVGSLSACKSPSSSFSPIHDAAKMGNLEKVGMLLKENPDLVFGKDSRYFNI
jgi:hypothetical protein